MSSKFIVIEGLEGAGKSTAVSYVLDWLRQHGITQLETTREPGNATGRKDAGDCQRSA